MPEAQRKPVREKRNPGAPRHASTGKEKGNGPAACDHVYIHT